MTANRTTLPSPMWLMRTYGSKTENKYSENPFNPLTPLKKSVITTQLTGLLKTSKGSVPYIYTGSPLYNVGREHRRETICSSKCQVWHLK